MTAAPLDEAYFSRLCDQVGSTSYVNLLRFLYEKEFTWQAIERDANRAQDGKDLRMDFLREHPTHQQQKLLNEMQVSGWLELGCSFLELLISLSWHLAFEGEGEQSDWFWHLINNLGLIHFTDDRSIDKDEVYEIVDRVINRTYHPSGEGGLFPLQHAEEDQREVELWMQLNAYLLERL